MSEERILLQSEGLKIEGLMDNVPGEKGVVVTHPHPLYGGEMHNNVVGAVVQVYRQMGYSTLRFNFRGAGQSEGEYDQGIGEQEDVRAALLYLSSLGKSSIDLVGYSFGAWVNAMGLKTFREAERMIMVSPPVNFMDFSFLDYNASIRLVIAGSEDEIGPPAVIEEMLPLWNSQADLKVIEGADHFYLGKTLELRKIVQHFLEMP
jgi:alpha/beta superfamily hydrolase